jgi:DNA-binding CsgD family transcriptional regulator
MPRLSGVQHEALAQLRRLASRSLLPEQLGTLLLSALHQAIPSDIQMLLGVDPASRLFNRLLALDERHTSGFWHWVEHIYLVGEPNWGTTFPAMMLTGLRAVVLCEKPETSWGIPPDLFHPLSAREFARCYHDIGAPAGGMLRTFFAVDGHDLAVLEMHRLEAHPSFQPTDLAFMRLMAPLIGKALRAAFDRERATTPLDLDEPETMTGVLILSPARTMTMATPAALTWMDYLRANERLKGTHLPTAVASAVASLSSRTQDLLPHTVQVQTSRGRLRIEAAVASEDGTLAVTLAPHHSRFELVVPATFPLTRAERQVCELLLRGHSNRQIAAALVVSEHTVESHCVHIYEKLGVHNRRELLGRFFQEVSLRELGAPRIAPTTLDLFSFDNSQRG